VNSTSASSQEIQALFDRIAPVYDQFNDWLSLGVHRVWKQMAVDWSRATVGATCLDVCCGSGDLAQLLAKRAGSTGKVYGVDFSSAQLAIARQRAVSPSQAPIVWLEGDALSLPFDANSFDAATMGYGLRNVVDISASLRELHRVLKPAATVAILDFHRPSQAHVQAFQQWYLETVVVPLAEHMQLRDDYAYIRPSLDRFPTGQQQVDLAKRAGFRQAVHFPIAAGMMGVLVATK
jgi:demethylphylloquinol methyltransferase